MRSATIKRTALFCFIQIIASGSLLSSQGIEKGQISDSVICSVASGQSYALYLPGNYDNKKSWPVIFIFDPAARGRTGVTSFLEAARKYGFILACSNNSRNGPLDNNFIAAAAMIGDVEGRYNIDLKRVFVSGFSGGSRFAMALAVTDKRIAGVIGCGAGLPNDKNYLPNGSSGFLYYGLAGTRDMNYPEMKELFDFFDKRTHITSYLRTFQGGHQWPEPGLITEAVEWLVLHDISRKIVPDDQSFLVYLENKTQDLINSQVSDGKLEEAVSYMRFAVRDFQGTPFAVRMLHELSNSEKSTEYKQAIRKRNVIIKTEQEKKDKYLNYLNETLISGSLPDSVIRWWKIETGELKKRRDKGNTENSMMSSRVLNFISILCSEQASSFYRDKSYDKAAFLFEICTLSDSENPNNYYNLARSLALSGKIKRAVDALSMSVNYGIDSKTRIASDPAFNGIRENTQYKTLIVKLK